MRRFSKEQAARANDLTDSTSAEDGEGAICHEEDAAGSQGAGESALSRREKKKLEQLEIQAILEEEGVLDEMEGKQVNHHLCLNPQLAMHCLVFVWPGST